jgi:hypothetical protein
MVRHVSARTSSGETQTTVKAAVRFETYVLAQLPTVILVTAQPFHQELHEFVQR